ncbi:P-loop containing nucleoside triphosphate hydrolase protein [Tricholoma matsutake]|nr:P-loop containing nucleoside triphosphate hydrolase protein [Tricholoma matsutake 945]
MTEFYHPPSQSFVKPHYDPINATHRELVTRFTSPPLMPGLLSCITEVLGPAATPTPIQSLSLKWLLNSPDASLDSKKTSEWKQFLLASETGSGKSIAYLLPLLQNLKLSELNTTDPSTVSERALNPRALILAPTHELARQLSGFAKALLHEIKLRVSCASRANVKNTKVRDSTTRKMIAQFEEEIKKSAGNSEEFDVKRDKFPVDVVVGTPMKLLEMVRGRGWDRREDSVEDDDAKAKLRRGRDKMVGFGNWKKPPEMGLANIEWVIVDEADILFDPDFQETTRHLLADISEARGHPVPSLSGETPSSGSEAEKHSLNYPFNLILASATIPSALASYLDMHHPKLMRLASPNLHHLPKTLRTEYASWTGGNKFADIERRVRKVWAEDLSGTPAHSAAPLSKILIFCNKSTTVNELGLHLEERGIKNVALTSTSDQRKRGSNQHLEGFLRKHTKDREETVSDTAPKPVKPTLQPLVKSVPPSTKFRSNPKEEPHVMITTSLLSRGLDFSPSIRHVFMVDEPRNMIDFLHRAGRAGRAGEKGKVVVFGKLAGRGSAKAKEVRKRVGALVA